VQKKLKSILVAVDGSPHSDRATDFAANLAQQSDAVLLILHVRAPVLTSEARNELEQLERMEHHHQTEYEIIQESGQQIALAAEQRARKSGAQRTEVMVEVGDPAKWIADMAHARQVDLVVLGRRGLGPIAQLLSGSVSAKLAQISECPVVIVP